MVPLFHTQGLLLSKPELHGADVYVTHYPKKPTEQSGSSPCQYAMRRNRKVYFCAGMCINTDVENILSNAMSNLQV